MANVLVVDDEADVATILRFRLERDGHAVTSAADGQSGLLLALSRPPDIILLDVMMPEMDGFEVLRRLKNDERTAQTPVIMLTARADFASVQQGWNLAVENYISKPFDVDEVARLVAEALASAAQMRE